MFVFLGKLFRMINKSITLFCLSEEPCSTCFSTSFLSRRSKKGLRTLCNRLTKPSLYSWLSSTMPVMGLENHSLKFRWDWNTLGMRKCIKDLKKRGKCMCKGWRCKEIWGQSNLPQLHEIVLQRSACQEKTTLALKVEQQLPTLGFEVFDMLGLVQDKVVPLLSSKTLVILQGKLFFFLLSCPSSQYLRRPKIPESPTCTR